MTGHAADDPREEALARLDALEDELGALSASVREAAARLRRQIDDVRAGIEALPAPPADVADPPSAPHPDGSGQAAEGARLVALDLVLSGTPRDEAVLRLAAEFPGVDAAALLDEAGATSAS